MKVTKKGEYALRALLSLALVHGQRSHSLRKISKEEKIPYKFLEQIMILLKKADFVQSIKGKFGGYRLTRSPKQVTLGEIIRAIEGPLAPLETAAGIKKRIRSEERHPGLYRALLEVRDAIAEIVDKKTLADICQESIELARSQRANPMYYI